MEQTAHYLLNQWDATDRIMREDFNADNAKIDEALKTLDIDKARLVTGTYTPTAEEAATGRHISLGFRPKAVLIFAGQVSHNYANQPYLCSGFLLDGHPLKTEKGATLGAIEDDGFFVQLQRDYYPYLASANVEYSYLALA